MVERLGGCRANYKQAVAEHVRGGAKTKDKLLINYLVVLIIIRCSC